MNQFSISPKRQGAWIVNISKHLINFPPNTIGLSYFENLFFAGKCGSLLIKVSADETEQLTLTKVKAHAQVSGITGPELKVCLETLRAFGCLGWNQSENIYEVYAFSKDRVLDTTSSIFEGSVEVTELEKTLPFLLEFCLLRPRLESEAMEFLTTLMSESIAKQLLELTQSFGLLGADVVLGKLERLFYNEYQFSEKNKLAAIGTA
jgi:hypothetical protein